jgi:hypothetical protein
VSWSKSYIWRTGEEAPRIWEAIGQPGGLLPNTAAQRGCRAGRIEPTAATHPTQKPVATDLNQISQISLISAEIWFEFDFKI